MNEYPAAVAIETTDRIDRWRAIVQPIFAIPHFIIVEVLSALAQVVALISWFAIVFTGRLPDGLARLQCMVIRYSMRTYAYAAFLHPSYPPFEFSSTPSEPGGTPVTVDVQPQLDDRNRLTVGLRILWMIPAALYLFVIAIVGMVCLFLGFWAVLFTGRWPDALRRWVVNTMRVGVRFSAYSYLLTDTYPPFSTD